MRRSKVVGTMAAVVAALGMSAGAPAAVGLTIAAPTMSQKAPAVPGTVKTADQKTVRRWRKDYIAARILRWRGVGMLSRGPRWPLAQLKRKVDSRVEASDGTRYVRLNTGELVRFPRKVHHNRPMRKQMRAFKEELRGQTA